MTSKYMSKQQLCNEIYAAVLTAREPLTRLEICKKIGRKKAPHILDMIEYLNREGYLNRTVQTNARGTAEFYYYVTNNPVSLHSEIHEPDEQTT